AGADAEVRLQLRECGRGDDPRKDGRCNQVAAAPRARVVAEADRARDRVMALEVGIVGLPSSGKSMLFEALTGATAQNEVGMAAIPDPRLQQLADVVHARKVTPAAIRVSEVRGTGPALLGNLRQVDALLVVLDGFSGTHVPADDLETLRLELLVADRDHVERRLERVAKQAKSGDATLKREAVELERLLAHLDAGKDLTD